MASELPTLLVIFDGVCGLCDSVVQWLLDHDAEGRLHYAPLQGELAAALRAQNPVFPNELDTIVFIREGKSYLRSQAVLQIFRELPAPWSWLSLFRFIPSVLTDLGYRALASSRYRLFGKLEACRIPEPQEAARFWA